MVSVRLVAWIVVGSLACTSTAAAVSTKLITGTAKPDRIAVYLAAAASDGRSGSEALEWKVQAGKTFQRVGEYVVRGRNTRLQHAIRAFGRPEACRVVGTNNHVVASWPSRGIWIDAWTYGLIPSDEDGCVSPDLIYVSEIRLTDRRWITALGLRVGDTTMKLRRLYPKSPYEERRGRNQYYLVWQHAPCIGVCTPAEERFGVDYPRLSAQVKQGRVVAFWIPVFGQGE